MLFFVDFAIVGACTWAHYARNNVAYKRGFAYWVNEGKGKQRGGIYAFRSRFPFAFSPIAKGALFYHRKKGVRLLRLFGFWVFWRNIIFLALITSAHYGGYFTRRTHLFFEMQNVSTPSLSLHLFSDIRHPSLGNGFRKHTGSRKEYP